MFATHYHELTVLEELYPSVKNYNIAVKKRGEDITFLRKIVPGGTDDSYGIEVAKLAGIPNEVIRRAKEVLASLDDGEQVTLRGRRKLAPMADQFAMDFDSASERDIAAEEIKKRLAETDINTLTPLAAMNLLYDLKNMI
jgi:DNA mismatch repair protein MutS